MSGASDEKYSTLGGRLREARNLAGLSQGQVARILGLHRPTVTEIEAGNRKVSAVELSKFAEAYDVTTSWLLAEVPDQLDASDPRLQLAARELSKLKPADLDRLLRLLASMRENDGEGSR
jgi:transcriptional regulator with XRE-family HTH domain